MLQRQTISLPLAQGVDTKTDEKQVEAGKLLELENAVFTKTKSIQKRRGNTAIGNGIAGSMQSVTNGIGLASYKEELLLANGTDLYSYDQLNDNWVSKSQYTPVVVSQFSVIKDIYSQRVPDGSTHSSGLQLYAWEDSQASNTIRYSVIDGGTNQAILSSQLLASNARRPRVLSVASGFAVYWTDIANPSAPVLKVALFLAAAPLSAPSVYTLTASGVSDNALDPAAGLTIYDACIVQGSQTPFITVVFNNSNSGMTVRVYDYNSPTTQIPGITQFILTTGAVLSVFNNNIDSPFHPDPCGPVVVYREDATDDIIYAPFAPDLTLMDGPNIIFNSSDVTQLTGCSNSEGAGFVVYASVVGLGNEDVAQAVVNDTYNLVSVNLTYQVNGQLWGRAFKVNGSAYVPVVYYYPPSVLAPSGNISLQSALFLLDQNASIIVRALDSTAAYRNANVGYSTGIILPDAVQHSPHSWRMTGTESVLVEGSLFQTQTNVVALDFMFQDPTQSVYHEELANNLHLSGGFLQMYDGIDVVEHGFHLYPIVYSATPSASVGVLADGTYYYTACYEWTDNQGNIHQSAPADPQKVVVTSGPKQVDLSISNLNYTAKIGSRSVQIVIYRTEKDGKILHRVSDLTTPQVNDRTVGSFPYTDNLADADLAVRPKLYTQPLDLTANAEVENFPAPPNSIVQLHRNRLWVVDSTSPLDIWYSKFPGPETPVAFNDGFVKQVDPRGGPITALSTIDDKLLVFKRDHIFFVVGQGPTNTDQNNDLSDSILVTTDCGCIDQRSITATPVGLMFQSRKGIYLIDRSLAVQYIGAPVEAYNNEVITSATLVADTNQVRFTLQSGLTLVYDYFVGQWGTFTNQYGKDCIIWQETPILLRSNGSIWRETPGLYTDAGLPIKLKLATSWFSFANLQGFQRVRRAQILGARKSPHQLQVSVCTDFNDTIVQQVVVTPSNPTAFGAGLYGAESLYGGEFQLYQWRVDLARQKTQSVKFIIEDLPAATAGEGMSLSSIAFEVGAKVGLNKVPASQIVS